MNAVEVHEGTNFRFGYRAEGGIAELIELGQKLGFRSGDSRRLPDPGNHLFQQQDPRIVVPRGHTYSPGVAWPRFLHRFHSGSRTRHWIHAYGSHHQPGAVSGVVAAQRSVRNPVTCWRGMVRCRNQHGHPAHVRARLVRGGVASAELPRRSHLKNKRRYGCCSFAAFARSGVGPHRRL